MKFKKRKHFLIFSLIFTPIALFYLFVLPALVATEVLPASKGAVAFAAFLYVQSWMLTAGYAYLAAADLYNIKINRFLAFNPIIVEEKSTKGKKSALATAFICSLSYLFTLYGFAIAYVYLSHIDIKAFNTGRLSLFDSIYFSVVTAATVGYGDITPLSMSARFLVIAEIFANLTYLIFFFSVIATGIQARRFEKSPNQEDAVDQAD